MSSEQHLIEQITTAYHNQTGLYITGAGQHAPADAQADHEVTLEMMHHAGIVSYVPDDLVITVKAGTSLAEICAATKMHQQTLPLIAPHQAATIGGLLASDTIGHGLPLLASARHLVLGTRLLDGQGRVLNFGGTVVKNVAGYDISRLQIGAWGAFGVLSQVSLKLVPESETTITLAIEKPQAEAINYMQSLARQYLPIAALSYQQGSVLAHLRGSQASVAHAQTILDGRAIDTEQWNMQAWLADSTHSTHSTREQNQQQFWAWLAPLDAPLDEETIRVDWAGHMRWLYADASAVQKRITQQGGRVAYHPNTLISQCALPCLVQQQLVRFKRIFDPRDILNHALFQSLVLSENVGYNEFSCVS